MWTEAGGRLVLLVDGHDEDRGVTLGPHAHSICRLLPADPSHGMRVVVAGPGPHPPIPGRRPGLAPLRELASRGIRWVQLTARPPGPVVQ